MYPSEETGQCVVFSKTAQPACLTSDTQRFNTTSTCSVSGWRDESWSSANHKYKETLQITNVGIQNFTECKVALRSQLQVQEQYHLCAKGSSNYRNNSCLGDSGGPLVCFNPQEETYCPRAWLYGTLSHGNMCNQDSPGRPTSHFKKFRFFDFKLCIIYAV